MHFVFFRRIGDFAGDPYVSEVRTITVAADDDGVRLDRWFKKHFPDLTHGRLQKLLRTGQVRLDGGRVKAGIRIEKGQEVRIPPMPAALPQARGPQRSGVKWTRQDSDTVDDLRDRVLYIDDDVLALNKPAGLAVQGGSKTHRHLDRYLPELTFGAKETPKLVHRLDKDTSGVLILARNGPSARSLTEKFRLRDVRKLYWALVVGIPEVRGGLIDVRLAKRGGHGDEKMVEAENGKIAQTVYQVIDHAGRHLSLVAAEPLTGRTHQIRAHLALALGTPIIGDGKYGGAEAFPEGVPEGGRLHLHARAVLLPGNSGQPILLEAPPSDHMLATCQFLGFDPVAEAGEFLDEWS